MLSLFKRRNEFGASEPGSVILDVDGKLWASCWHSRRLAGRKVLKFDPAASDGSSVKFNPLEELPFGTPDEVAAARTLAYKLIARGPQDGAAAYIEDCAADLFIGCVLHMHYSPQVPWNERNLAGVLKFVSRLLASPSGHGDGEVLPGEHAFEAMATADHAARAEHYWSRSLTGDRLSTHPYVQMMCRRMLGKGPLERSMVVGWLLRALGLWADPAVARNTAQSDFCLRDVQRGNTPTDLFVVVRDADLDRMRPLTRFIVPPTPALPTSPLSETWGHRLAAARSLTRQAWRSARSFTAEIAEVLELSLICLIWLLQVIATALLAGLLAGSIVPLMM